MFVVVGLHPPKTNTDGSLRENLIPIYSTNLHIKISLFFAGTSYSSVRFGQIWWDPARSRQIRRNFGQIRLVLARCLFSDFDQQLTTTQGDPTRQIQLFFLIGNGFRSVWDWVGYKSNLWTVIDIRRKYNLAINLSKYISNRRLLNILPLTIIMSNVIWSFNNKKLE